MTDREKSPAILSFSMDEIIDCTPNTLLWPLLGISCNASHKKYLAFAQQPSIAGCGHGVPTGSLFIQGLFKIHFRECVIFQGLCGALCDRDRQTKFQLSWSHLSSVSGAPEWQLQSRQMHSSIHCQLPRPGMSPFPLLGFGYLLGKGQKNRSQRRHVAVPSNPAYSKSIVDSAPCHFARQQSDSNRSVQVN